MGCRLSHAQQWAIRAMHESMMHEYNSFITLTYSPENLPADLSLDHTHYQKFYKRLRFHLAPENISPRFLMCGEYGSRGDRPHYHALIFGYDFPDKTLWQDGKSKLYRSKTLELLWPHGFSTIGEVNYKTAQYVAGYIRKKLKGKAADTPDENGLKAYELYDQVTGEIIKRAPEYAQMSRRPGIGSTFYEKYGEQIRNHDYCVMDSSRVRVPGYYDKLTERHDSEILATIKRYRQNNARKYAKNNTPERLAAREAFKQTVINKSHKRTQF